MITLICIMEISVRPYGSNPISNPKLCFVNKPTCRVRLARSIAHASDKPKVPIKVNRYGIESRR